MKNTNQKPKNQGHPPPSPALARPQNLKSWANSLSSMVSQGYDEIFRDFEYRENNLTHCDLNRTLAKMRGCASVVELRSRVDRDTGEVGAPCIHAANYCGQFVLCPVCASRLSDKRRARFAEPIKCAVNAHKWAYMVTATISATETWRESVRGILGGWKSFRLMGQKRKGRKKGRDSGEFGKIKAGVSKMEIKRGDGSGLPHCHIHALFFTDEPFDFRVWSDSEKEKSRENRVSLRAGNMSKISAEWMAATGGNGTGIRVDLIRWKKPKRHENEAVIAYRDRCENWSLSDSVLEQSREVFKYATKFEATAKTQEKAILARDFIGIKSSTFGRRCFQTYGEFRDQIIGNDPEIENPRTENPILYAARWNVDRYGGLEEIKTPLFPELEPGPYRSANLKILNRIQGATRRIRRAVFDAKADFLTCGFVSPAIFGVRTYLPEGGFTEKPIHLEPPAELLADPHDLRAWENWVDALSSDGRDRYSEARNYLRQESRDRLTGTAEELAAEAAFERAVYLKGEAYIQDVINSFLEILAPPDTP